MSEEVIKILDDLSSRFGVMIDWSSENVLPKIMEVGTKYQYYQIAKNSIFTIIWFVLIFISVKFFIRIIKEYRCQDDTIERHYTNHLYDEVKISELAKWLIPLCIVVSLISAICTTITIHNLLAWIFIPEIEIIEDLINLINNI